MSAPTGPGHVFVARRSLELIDADGVVAPTDANFLVEPHWGGIWASAEAPTKPAGWSQKSVAKWDLAPAAGPAVWFIDVAVHEDESPDPVIQKIVVGVGEVFRSCADVPRRHERKRTLVALPTLGVGLGGLNEVRGDLITRLLQGCAAGADEFGVDVVVVAYDPADYAACQYVRRQPVEVTGIELPPELDRAARALARRAKLGDLALFIGAGVSMSASLPSWDKLVEQLQRHIPEIEAGHQLNALDLAELIAREDDDFRQHVVEAISGHTQPGLSHLLLASLGCDEVVTTNFDLLYEKAANYRTTETTGTTVLPWQSRQERGPWLLKMHGDTSKPSSIVLSRSDFVDYDAASGPAGAAVQALMLSRHLLVVGASLTDDNFLRLAHEVTRYLKTNAAPVRQFGTVLSLGPETARKRLYKDTFDYVDTNGASADDHKPRASAIFLDALAMYASKDAGFLLDPRYRSALALVAWSQSSLLSGSTARAVTAIRSALPAMRLASSEGSGPMGELWNALRLFGASDVLGVPVYRSGVTRLYQNSPAETPGTWNVATGTAVKWADAVEGWAAASRPALLDVAATYNRVITYNDLGESVQGSTGVRTRSLLNNWIGRVLEFAQDCFQRGEVILTALCVHQDGTVGEGFSAAASQFPDGVHTDDADMHAAEIRIAGYQKYANNVPADGGQPRLTPEEAARRKAKEPDTAPAMVRFTTRPSRRAGGATTVELWPAEIKRAGSNSQGRIALGRYVGYVPARGPRTYSSGRAGRERASRGRFATAPIVYPGSRC